MVLLNVRNIKVEVIIEQLLLTMSFMCFFENNTLYGAHENEEGLEEEEEEDADKGSGDTGNVEETQEEEGDLTDSGDF